MKYRLVKKIYASGMIIWRIERKVLLWWEYLDGYADEKKAYDVLQQLANGEPYTRQVVVATVWRKT